MPVALPIEEGSGFPRQQHKKSGYSSIFAETRDFSPPQTGLGGILPAESHSNEKPRRGGPMNNLTPMKGKNNNTTSGSGKLSVQFLSRAMDRCNSPRAMSMAAQFQSPRASRRPPNLMFYDTEVTDEDADTPTQVPESPMHQSCPFSPGAAGHGGSPPRSPLSPMAEAQSEEYPSALPVFMDSAAKSPQAHCSPGGFGRASRRPVLGKSRMGQEPATPSSVMKSAWKGGRGTVKFAEGSSPGPVTPGGKTPQTARRTVFGEDEGVQPTQLLDTFMQEYGDKTPHFTPDGKFVPYGSGDKTPIFTPDHNFGWSPKGSPSSVGSIPIFYDEEEYGFERPDLDYSQYEYLKEMIPPPAFSVQKPAIMTLDVGDDSDEEEHTASPRVELFGTPKGSDSSGGAFERHLEQQQQQQQQQQPAPKRAGGGQGPASMRRRLFGGGAPSPGRRKSKPPTRPWAGAGSRPMQRGSRLQQATAAQSDDSDEETAAQQAVGERRPDTAGRFDRQQMCRGVLASDLGLPVVHENRQSSGQTQHGRGLVGIGAGLPANRPSLGRSKSYNSRPVTAPEPSSSSSAPHQRLEIRSKENIQSSGPDVPPRPRPPSARPGSAPRRPLGALLPTTTQRPGTGEAPSLCVVGCSILSSSMKRPVFGQPQASKEALLPPIQPAQPAQPAQQAAAGGGDAWAAPRPPSASNTTIPSLPRLDRRFSARG